MKQRKFKFYILLIVVLAGLVFLFFNEYGVIKYLELKNQVEELNIKYSIIEEENTRLKSEIDSLQKKIPAKIEKSAREKYRMIKPGETSIEIKEN